MSLLPGQIIPQGVSLGTVDANGNVTISQQWWLFFYNVYLNSIGSTGSIPDEAIELFLSCETDSATTGLVTARTVGTAIYPPLATEKQPIYPWFPVGNVLRYGADPTGVTDSSSAFTRAAQSAPAGVNSQGSIGGSGITFAPNATVTVPAGNYLISSEINTSGVDVTWQMADDAIVANYQFLNGRLERSGRRVNKYTYGIGDFATGFSVGTNDGLEQGANVLGFSSAQQRQTLNYTTFDSVGLYFENTAVAPIQAIASTGTTYTASTVAFTASLTSAQFAQIRSGMYVGTQHSPSWYGYITAWNSNTITVSGWYQMGGSGTGTPANSVGAYINPITKVFGGNSAVILPSTSIATAAAAHEFDTINDLSDPGGFGGSPLCWGIDSVNLGTYACESAFIARGSWYYGFSIGSQVNNASSTVYGFFNDVTYGNSITANGIGFLHAPTLAANTAIINVRGYQASSAALGAGASITTQVGFEAEALSGATNNYGFLSKLNSGTGNYAFYGQGTAPSLFGGTVQVQGALGVNGVTPPAQSTGWGTPTGISIVTNFPGASATLLQCSETIAALINIGKQLGFLAT